MLRRVFICHKRRRKCNKRFLLLLVVFLMLNYYSIELLLRSAYDETLTVINEETVRRYKPIPLSQSQNSCQDDDSEDTDITSNAEPKSLKCSTDWVFIENDGRARFNHEFLTANGIKKVTCTYKVINWSGDDFSFTETTAARRLSHGEILNKSDEFFYVDCKSSGQESYKSLFAKIFDDDKEKMKQKPEKAPINVMLIGLDSVSRKEWIQNLPKSSEYWIKEMEASVLTRYNIVGDGTPAALLPLLTSMTEEEMPDRIFKSHPASNDANYLDQVLPFVWANFSRQLGYKTMFGEDWPSVGTFQYRFRGMSKPPVDHYLRPFHLALEAKFDKFSLCLGGRSILQANSDYIKSFMLKYSQTGFFGMLFLNVYSHDSHEKLGYADADFYNLLTWFTSQDQINSNTILILFADHGPRFSANRKTIKGLLRERNPFFSMFIPIEFKKRYPAEYKAFKSNRNKLTTPMDIHQTLVDLITLEKSNTHYENSFRSKSLFQPISEDRDCKSAGVSDHWCACLKRTQVKVDSHLSNIASWFVDDYINKKLLGNHADKCARLNLTRVNKVYLLDTLVSGSRRERVNKHISSNSSTWHLFKNLLFGPRLLLPPTVEKDYVQYLFQIETGPNQAVYEFTVLNEFDLVNLENNLSVNERSISRVNAYGNAPSCIWSDYPELRKYCYCI